MKDEKVKRVIKRINEELRELRKAKPLTVDAGPYIEGKIEGLELVLFFLVEEGF
jgi:hypothetical protein